MKLFEQQAWQRFCNPGKNWSWSNAHYCIEGCCLILRPIRPFYRPELYGAVKTSSLNHWFGTEGREMCWCWCGMGCGLLLFIGLVAVAGLLVGLLLGLAVLSAGNWNWLVD